MKFPNLYNYFFWFTFLVSSLTSIVYSQTISPQTLVFGKICAGNNFNQFDATFTYSSFPAGTTFEVQLSDNLGSFSNPVSTTILSITDVSTIQKTIRFAVPTNLIGTENCKLRIKASTGFTSSSFPVKDPNNASGTLTYFPAYFKPFEDVYYINNKKSTASICTGGSVTLSIDNPTPSIPNTSPANYPNIKYKWYKGTSVIAGQTSATLVVSTTGSYYVEMDYGSCTDTNSRSNTVAVSVSSGGGAATVNSSLGNPFCSSGTPTILSLSSQTGNTFQWYKNNAKLNGETNSTLSANEAGLYSVFVDFGGCANTYAIDLKEFKIQSSLNIPQAPQTSIIVDGETKKIIVTTNAASPTFEWYKNDILIPGSTVNTYDASSVGDYKVKITQQSGCVISDELHFILTTVIDPNAVQIPNLISPNNDGTNDTWVIPGEYCIGSNSTVEIRDSVGKVVFTTNSYLNNWPETPIDFKNINPVFYYIIKTQDGSERKGSITIVK